MTQNTTTLDLIERGHRSFQEAADGRPFPPMMDELMTAGLNCDDARFVAIQLAQNGLTLVSAAQPAQEAEVEIADAALTEWEDNNVLVPPHISGLALCAEYMRRTADFNRSWVDGRNGPRAGDYIGNSPGYIARRIQAAELFDRMAGAALDALRALPAAQVGAEVELVTNADELRAELRRALAQIDSLEAECDRRHAQTEAARDEARRMDLARNQFLGERNMLAEALRDIQRGDMTNMMELTEAEAARARATWALRKIGEPVGDFRAEQKGDA